MKSGSKTKIRQAIVAKFVKKKVITIKNIGDEKENRTSFKEK
jgi:hypothetical protein